MNLLAVPSLNGLSLHIMVERIDSGHFMASVPELTDCVTLAETREAAIATIQEKVRARVVNIEVLTITVPDNPWTDFIGMFEGDDEFAEIAAELRQERELDID
jgi:hypothetical protein